MIIRLHNYLISRHIKNLFMKMSDTLATVAIIRQKTLELSRDIKTQFMKVSDILATVVIIRLHN